MPTIEEVPGRVSVRFRNRWPFKAIEMTQTQFSEGIQHSEELSMFFDPVANFEHERAGIVGFMQLQSGRYAVYIIPEPKEDVPP